MDRCDKISDVGVEKLLKGVKNLESLWLNLRGLGGIDVRLRVTFLVRCDRITDVGLKSLGEDLKEIQSLKKLALKLRG